MFAPGSKTLVVGLSQSYTEPHLGRSTIHIPVQLPVRFDLFGSAVVVGAVFQFYPLRQCFLLYFLLPLQTMAMQLQALKNSPAYREIVNDLGVATPGRSVFARRGMLGTTTSS